MAPTTSSSSGADHIIGVFSRGGLSAALAAMHRAGFGPQTRVLDGARGALRRQLERAGLRLEGDDALSNDAVLIVVAAPGRVAIVAELFARLGAETVSFASRRGDQPPAEPPPILAPDIRIAGDAGAVSEA